jgi:omega-hydroxy-beta-dihydromenaquinone-9 sulfotransferase
MTDALGSSINPPVPLLGGQTLLRWIDDGGPFHRSSLLHRRRLQWAAFWFERHLKLTSNSCGATELPTKMIFILGLWRSGTTELHNALKEATGWATPQTWQCFRPANFLFTPPPRELVTSRPMDEGRIGTFTPQEDEFAALLLGEDSVYRAFIDPRRFTELAPLLRQWQEPLSTGLSPLSANWEVFLKGVSQRTENPLILKSPNHTYRLPWLAKRFPEGQFIWLTRSKQDVLASNLRMWTAMIDRYSLWRGDLRVLEKFLEYAMLNHDALLDWGKTTIPDRVHVVPFERVMQDRATLVSELLSRLDHPKS